MNNLRIVSYDYLKIEINFAKITEKKLRSWISNDKNRYRYYTYTIFLYTSYFILTYIWIYSILYKYYYILHITYIIYHICSRYSISEMIRKHQFHQGGEGTEQGCCSEFHGLSGLSLSSPFSTNASAG